MHARYFKVVTTEEDINDILMPWVYYNCTGRENTDKPCLRFTPVISRDLVILFPVCVFNFRICSVYYDVFHKSTYLRYIRS